MLSDSSVGEGEPFAPIFSDFAGRGSVKMARKREGQRARQLSLFPELERERPRAFSEEEVKVFRKLLSLILLRVPYAPEALAREHALPLQTVRRLEEEAREHIAYLLQTLFLEPVSSPDIRRALKGDLAEKFDGLKKAARKAWERGDVEALERALEELHPIIEEAVWRAKVGEEAEPAPTDSPA